ncbi:MAG: VOC family protein [Actinomycetia bacterium]|nr:VOC family protein [Actinomycetes bacterium]MCP4226235.1 VOC family protein [Actinomycetes bacterium]MCP5032728.1 VOC family protein [Actinomycetes bacterium]
MTTHVAAVTLDCANALTVAEFWSAVLGRPIVSGEPAASPFFARIAASDGDHPSPMMMFIQVPESKTVKNRMHLDLGTDNREAEIERLVGLGATRIHDKEEWGVQWTTLSDPEGNEFCIAEH